MNKKELIKKVAINTGKTQKLTAEILDAILEEIPKSVISDGEVLIVGFGKFQLVERAAKVGRNPATGEPMNLPEKKAIKFKPSKNLRDFVNGE